MRKKRGRPRKTPVSDVCDRRQSQPKPDRTVSQPNEFVIHNHTALLNMYYANKYFKPLRYMSDKERAERYSLKYDNKDKPPTKEELDGVG